MEIPWDAMKRLISGVNYGGHVTDDWDRRLLTAYIHDYCEAAINQPFFELDTVTHINTHSSYHIVANRYQCSRSMNSSACSLYFCLHV